MRSPEHRELAVDELYRATDPAAFSFQTTAELPDLPHPVAQSRATEAIELGAAIDVEGYNLFVLGA